MRFRGTDDVRLGIVPREGAARGVSREGGCVDVYWIPTYDEDVQIFLSTPFETPPDQKFSEATGPTNLKIFPSGVFTPA